MDKLDLSYIAGGNIKWYSHYGFLELFDDLKKQHAVSIDIDIEVAQSCPTLCDPMDYSQQAPMSMGFSRQEYCSG